MAEAYTIGKSICALVRVEVEEQLVRLVDDLGDAGVRPVDLVDHEDDRQPRLQRLAQHEPGLRQRSLAGVDEQQDAVDHRQPALDLAAEVGVPGVSMMLMRHRPPVGDVPDRGVLGQDRDALLALEVHRVHDPLGDASSAWCALKAPDCQSIASTSVVLPWSTCATIATLRRSSRRALPVLSVVTAPPLGG